MNEGDGKDYGNVDELIVEKSDIEVTKTFNNSFWETELKKILDKLNVELVVLCGSAAEYCVLATYNGAIERGFKAAMLQNGIFASSETGLNDIAINRAIVSYEVISFFLNNKV